ncbi:MAG: recombinase family protein, partial [Planctomycetaceae bacterium]|nr:recombinase family protein [Planctomycetaceae bacterium]
MRKHDQSLRGTFYTRDSGGRHEMTLPQYVDWARRRAAELGVTFGGTAAEIETMARSGVSVQGDLFLDYEVAGNQLTRPGLDALRVRLREDKSITHLFIPHRDRLARPDNPLDAMQIEVELRAHGVTLVYQHKELAPLPRGSRQDIGELITQLVDFDQAGRFRHELGQKMVFAQLTLARAGHSTGGRAPYGFDRWLVSTRGERIRRLQDGERVRMSGHHVAWIPAEDGRLEVALRIRQMLLTMPATQVARQLNAEGVPSPDFGRTRTDNGVTHAVSGRWNVTSIVNIGRNPLLTAVTQHGVRSMGDQLRFTAEGPRPLNESDYRIDGKPKVVRNPAEHQIRAQAHFGPVTTEDEHRQLQEVLDARAGTQRGKPRSRDPNRNPLGCRIFDMACGWPMYRVPYKFEFQYRCGLHQQSGGQDCEHNQIDGPLATRFALGCISQRLLEPDKSARLKQKLEDLARRKPERNDTGQRELSELQQRLQQVSNQLQTVEGNLALAANEAQFRSISRAFDQLTKQKHELEQQLAALKRRTRNGSVSGDAVQHVLGLIDRLADLAGRTDDLSIARQLLEAANLRLFLKFAPVQAGARKLNRLQHGVVTMGDAPAPIPIYAGPTSRKRVKSAAPVAATAGDMCSLAETPVCGGEVKSLGNVSRDDCRSFEPWTTVRDTYATSFFSPRPWYLSELEA